jgi:glycosyltransferase involved in cell wall biosynthesis
MHYYDVVLGNDMCVYPSYYEPWGYTPLEAIAFKVPCITTDLAGFGLWANTVKGDVSKLEDGVEVVHRTDYNYDQVVNDIADTIYRFALLPNADIKKIRNNAQSLSKKALWSKFIKYYYDAYDFALQKASNRV